MVFATRMRLPPSKWQVTSSKVSPCCSRRHLKLEGVLALTMAYFSNVRMKQASCTCAIATSCSAPLIDVMVVLSSCSAACCGVSAEVACLFKLDSIIFFYHFFW